MKIAVIPNLTRHKAREVTLALCSELENQGIFFSFSENLRNELPEIPAIHFENNKKKFEKYSTFTIHTTEGEFEYKVFAAVPFNNKHLLYYNNFSKFSGLQKFLKKVYAVDDSKAHFNTDIEIGENDRIVILATCMDGNGSKRYLVMGVYQESDNSAETAEQ